MQSITETKIIVVTRYSGRDAWSSVKQIIGERRTGDLHIHLSEGSVQAVEFSETKHQPIDADVVFAK